MPNILMHCACATLRQASRLVTQRYEAALKPCDLQLGHFSLLMAIAHHGILTVNELSEIAVMDRTTVSRTVQLMEQQGLINLTSVGRHKQITITSTGEQKRQMALPLWESAQASFRETLDPQQWQTLHGLLMNLIDTLQPAQGLTNA